MPDPFISRTDLSDMLGRDVTNDAGALAAVDAACDVCRKVAEQDFNAGTGTVTLDGTGTDALLLHQQPVTAAGTVLVNGGTVTDYVLTGNGMLLRGSAGIDPRPVWPSGRQNVMVTYDYGYADVDLPRDIRMVALSIAARIVVQGVAVEESVGQVRVKYAGPAMDLSKSEEMILRRYRPTR